MQRGRQLDVRTAYVSRELQPLLDRNIGIRVPFVSRCQFLQCSSQQTQLHDPGLKLLCCHASFAS
jgi:hypothetical protein